ncbi:MAG: GAF domain-containing protein [Gemmatimonadales bacterium]
MRRGGPIALPGGRARFPAPCGCSSGVPAARSRRPVPPPSATVGIPPASIHPSVSGEMRVRFYAGRPVRIAGRRVGALCVVDRRPRELRDDDLWMLDDLATLVEKELATRAVD